MARGGRGAPQPVVRRDVRWFSAAILVTCVTVAGLGLAMGLYLDRAPEPVPKPVENAGPAPAPVPLPMAAAEPARPAAPAVAIAAEPQPAPEPDPPSAAGAPSSEPTPAPAPPTVAAEPPPPALEPRKPPVAAEPLLPAPENQGAIQLAPIEPQAGTTAAEPLITPRATRTAAMVVPPLGLIPSASYWVEYAVFSRERTAQRLRQSLAGLHLETTVVATHAPNGHRLWRVRSAPLDGRAGAEAAAITARQKLAIAPLIHRGSPGRVLPAQYWVQFGAFPTKGPAVHLQQVLADNGVKATVRHARASNGKSLFLVRSEGFSDRKLAVLVGELGGSAAKVAFVLGRSGPVTRQGAPPGTAERAGGSSLPRHVHRPPPGS